ncbi:MAG: hypothetical protein JST80_01190 [Bdellovibrionales bacterium]|nr:hypothetical protein [Bdellovibrionales bacterium]
MSYQRLGVSNVMPADTRVIYSRVPGRGSVGRISDLFAHAGKFEFKMDLGPSNAAGVLVHALLDGVFILAKGASVYIEAASGAHELLIATRFSIAELIDRDAFPTGLEVWAKEIWEGSDAMNDLRQLMRPTDRIEIRFNMKLKLVEWRIARKPSLSLVKDGQPTFVVIEDDSDRIHQGSDLPKELSELPFDKWLEDVYKTGGRATSSGSGEIYFQGESLQNEEEMSRVIANREKISVADTVKQEMYKNCWEDGVEDLDLKSTIDAENEQRVEQKAEEIVAGIEEVKDERAKVIIQDTKRKELRAKHDLIVSQRKIDKYEQMLQEKEKSIQKKANEIRYLNAKLLEKTGNSEFTDGAQKIREKAMQMADALKKAKEDNELHEKTIFELRQKNRMLKISASVGNVANNEGSPTTVAQQQIDDLLKRVDRVTRALEAEKAKVNSLSERVATAEKEAQTASPIIEDLELKVENQVKVAQQHKKETEQVKQRLVQSDAEKNKIKNELVKAQAQIQTLMKRQAS